MRDYLVLGWTLLSAPIALFIPYYGILCWHFIAFLNPHRFAWSLAQHFPLAYVIAVPTLIGMFLTRDTNRKIFTREIAILAIMWVWFCVTLLHCAETPFLAGHLSDGYIKFVRVTKILVMAFATFYLVNTKEKLRWLLLLVAGCFVLLDAKGGIWSLATGGQYRVYGPEKSFLEDNNSFAMATVMVMPLMFFLAWDEPRKWVRYLLRFGFFFGIVATMFTYSRGGFLGMSVVLTGIAIKAKRKAVGAAMVVAALLAMFVYSPEKWVDRMEGFMHGNIDGSAEQRLVTWGMGLNFIQDYPIFGGGFQVYPDITVYQKYQPRPMPNGRQSAGPHSIYFEMLGEHGIPGLLLFLSLVTSTIATVWNIKRRAKIDPQGRWALITAHSLELAIYGYLVSGAFLEFGNFDLWYLYVITASVTKLLYDREIAYRQIQASAQSEHPLIPQLADVSDELSGEVYV